MFWTKSSQVADPTFIQHTGIMKHIAGSQF